MTPINIPKPYSSFHFLLHYYYRTSINSPRLSLVQGKAWVHVDTQLGPGCPLVSEVAKTGSWPILGLYKDNGKENGSYCSILGLYRDRDDRKENGTTIVYGDYIRIMEKKMETTKIGFRVYGGYDRILRG